ncbi:MAG: ATP phosphoribosyltransferase, partial [Armatimonadaceae bacterium]
ASWADDVKRGQIENMAMLLTGALRAGELVGLKMNVSESNLQRVVDQLPALRKPTVSPLYGDSGFALEIIVEDKTSRDLIPRLKRAGAEGIVEYSLSKVVH